MEEYTAFAKIYDEFMDNVDYGSWCARIVDILKEHGVENGLVLDLGCGTGTLTEMLSKAGYDMTGIDSSDEMLQKAIEKRDISKEDILYLCQDMREFELYGTMAAVVSACDCLNYIIEKEELLQVFKLVNNYLDPGGIFIFDFNTRGKYEKIGSDSIAEARDDAAFIWENYYDEEERINEYYLNFFVKNGGGTYDRTQEEHYERAYSLEEIKGFIEKSGMRFEAAYDAFTFEPAREDSERICVIAREIMKKER